MLGNGIIAGRNIGGIKKGKRFAAFAAQHAYKPVIAVFRSVYTVEGVGIARGYAYGIAVFAVQGTDIAGLRGTVIGGVFLRPGVICEKLRYSVFLGCKIGSQLKRASQKCPCVKGGADYAVGNAVGLGGAAAARKGLLRCRSRRGRRECFPGVLYPPALC